VQINDSTWGYKYYIQLLSTLRGFKMQRYAILFVAVLFFGIIQNIQAQWVQTSKLRISDRDQAVNFLTADGNNLFACYDTGGVFLSADNGTSWELINNGLPKNNWSGFQDSTWTRVNTIAVKDGNLFAGSDMGVYVSANSGTSWSPVNNGLPKHMWDTSTFIPIKSFTVIGNALFAGTFGKGVFLSTNNAALWSSANIGLTDVNIYSLASSSGNIYAGTDTLGLFLSTNNGTSWAVSNSGLPIYTIVRVIVASDENIYAGTDNGVFISTNNGANWTRVTNGLADTVIISLVMSESNLFVGTNSGVFLSTNNGTNWTNVNFGLPSYKAAYSLAVIGDNIFLGTWGSVWRRPISEMLVIPPAPVLSSPRNDTMNLDTNLILSWNASGGELCSLQVSTDSSFLSTIISQKAMDSTHYRITGLTKNTKYYWRVNSSSAVGNSPWSTIWHFTTIPSPPSTVPYLIFPSSGAAGIPVNPALRWNKVATASTYRIQWSTLSDFSTTKDTSGVADTILALSNLANNTKYYWHVMAANAGGAGNWSTASNFTTVIASPVLVFPAINATGVVVNPTLRWNKVTAATSYQLQTSIATDFSTTVKDSSGLSDTLSLSGLANSTTYHWRVRAINSYGSSTWSVANFTTIIPVPDPVSLLSPSDTAIIASDSLLLVWHKSSPAISNYRLQIATDSAMTQFIVQQSSITDTFKLVKSLSNGVSYWWRVQAQNVAGWGAYSPKFRFAINLQVTSVLPKSFEVNSFGLNGSVKVLKYALPQECFVSVKYYDPKGRLIASIINSKQSPGYYSVSMPIAHLARGSYIQVFKAGSFIKTERYLLVD
jgi:hypothetical protein